MNPTDLSLTQLATEIRGGSISPVEVVDAFLERIERLNPQLNAYVLMLKETARQEAKAREKEVKEGKYRGPLHGIPMSLKDNIYTKGITTAAGSKLLANWAPDHDAAVLERLRAGGAIILGKTNLHEWAKGSTTANPFFGTTRNPWKTDRVPGGSSGGSAAAVAASLCLGSLGTDAAGSVRMPASLCGVAGLKPTFGRIPHHGVVDGSGSWSFDTIGILTRTSEDAARMLEVLGGPDERDKSSLGLPPQRPIDVDADLKGTRLGVVRRHFYEKSAEEVQRGVDAAIKVFERLGFSVEEVQIPHIDYAPFLWSTISRSEAWASHRELIRTRPNDYSRGILTRILLGKFIGASHYLNAQRARSLLIKEFDEALSRVDYLLTPSTPIPAPTLQECQSGWLNVDGRKEEVGGIYSFLASCTIPFNLSGHPTLSTLCGFSADGLPLGLQITGRPFDESGVLAVGWQYEKAAGWKERRPVL